MSQIAISSPSSQSPVQSAPADAPDRVSRYEEMPLAYLELTPRKASGVAYALIAHCRRVGPPRTDLRHDLAGLHDFLLELLNDAHVAVLLDAS